MPRAARITTENACYHIITRGNQKQPVFLDSRDFEKYLAILTRYKREFQFKVYCFCLMPNHVHLMLEVSDPSMLSKIMKKINLSYALYFNYKHGKVGHLWQDRFKSKIIEKEVYLLECLNYIEANPVRASLADNLNEYPWSSYKFRYKNSAVLDNLFSL
jgi:putative transposase